ncbi:hypothetical protein BDR05DRAFT_1005814, partial [Suillus weaverae]
ALGDNSCDLHVVPNPSTGPLTVDLPSSPVPPSAPVLPSPPIPPSAPVLPSPPIPPSAPVLPSPPIVAGLSSQTTSDFQDKGKGKEVAVDVEPEVEGSRKQKSPMISGHSSQPPKSVMKGRKRVKSTRPVKSKLIVESEDDEETIVQPISRGVPEVILPPLSTILVRQPQLPRSPGSPKKQSFGPASLTAGSGLEVLKTPISRPEVMATSDSHPEVVQPDDASSVSDGGPPAIPTFDITIPGPVKQPLPFLRQGRLAILDLHSMTIAIRDAAACIAVLEVRVREQDGKIDTLQCLHESLRCKVVNRHPSFPLPDSPGNATLLLDQSLDIPSMSPLPSALPNLINLDMGVMEPTNMKVEDQSAMVGLVFEPSEVLPEGPQSSGKNVVPDDPVNLLAEYNSVDEEMDVEVKDEPSGEEVKMVT